MKCLRGRVTRKSCLRAWAMFRLICTSSDSREVYKNGNAFTAAIARVGRKMGKCLESRGSHHSVTLALLLFAHNRYAAWYCERSILVTSASDSFSLQYLIPQVPITEDIPRNHCSCTLNGNYKKSWPRSNEIHILWVELHRVCARSSKWKCFFFIFVSFETIIFWSVGTNFSALIRKAEIQTRK